MTISLIIYCSNTDKDYKPEVSAQESATRVIKHTKWPLILALVLLIAAPDRKDIYMILGGYYVTNSEQIKQLPDNVLGAVNTFMHEYAGTAKDVVKDAVTDAKEVAKSATKQAIKEAKDAAKGT